MQLFLISHYHAKPVLALPFMGPEDSVLFLEDGVYYCLQEDFFQLKNKKMYVLIPHLTIRGLLLPPAIAIEGIDYPQFVTLSCQSDNILPWHL